MRREFFGFFRKIGKNIATCCDAATRDEGFSQQAGKYAQMCARRRHLCRRFPIKLGKIAYENFSNQCSAVVPKDAYIFLHSWGKGSAARWYNILLLHPSRPRRVSRPGIEKAAATLSDNGLTYPPGKNLMTRYARIVV